MTDTEKYNDLPLEVRRITGGILDRQRIHQLNLEKKRLKKRYQQSVKEINEHIKSIQEALDND